MLDKDTIADPNDVSPRSNSWKALNLENRPWTITRSPSATIILGAYFSVGGMLLMRLNRPSRPGAMCALCWM